ncbi:hypothetical protein [Paraburkholderia hospita]|uniref:hypothetical protein n=1 Tax=Paraburkholderia hospita TaxID=169430 RepID=UPI001055761D|nr:hypothetical protein [Paraburkholderia hospita]
MDNASKKSVSADVIRISATANEAFTASECALATWMEWTPLPYGSGDITDTGEPPMEELTYEQYFDGARRAIMRSVEQARGHSPAAASTTHISGKPDAADGAAAQCAGERCSRDAPASADRE